MGTSGMGIKHCMGTAFSLFSFSFPINNSIHLFLCSHWPRYSWSGRASAAAEVAVKVTGCFLLSWTVVLRNGSVRASFKTVRVRSADAGAGAGVIHFCQIPISFFSFLLAFSHLFFCCSGGRESTEEEQEEE